MAEPKSKFSWTPTNPTGGPPQRCAHDINHVQQKLLSQSSRS